MCSKEKEKEKKEKKKQKETICFYMIASVFSRKCESYMIGDNHFQANVIDDVDNLFDYYLHITFFVLCTLTSCTHYTQIFIKFCTYDYMLTNVAIFNCIWSIV